jgi:hypothetical protein
MKTLALMLLFAVSLPAITISAGDTTVLLHPGDGLEFQIFTWNFSCNAARYGSPTYPTDVSFSFITAPIPLDDEFSAWLESPDGSVAIPFTGSLFFEPGFFSSSRFSGPISILSAYLHLTPAEASAVFQSGSAAILLVNDGSDITLGFPPNTLRQDLWVTLSGGPLTVGALSNAASIQPNIPEPAMVLPILLVGGLILGGRLAGKIPAQAKF